MKYLTTILMAITAITPIASFAQDNTTPPEALAFTLKCTRDNWEITGEFDSLSQGYTEQTSKTTAGNSYWKAEYFGNSSSRGDIWCGSKNWSVNAKIYNENPISEKISKIDIYTTVNYPDDISNLSGLSLHISSDFEMSDPVIITYEGDKERGYWQFILDNPERDMYYSLNYDIAKSKEALIAINRIDFYRQLSPTPLINKIYDADNKIDHIEVVSEIGDLHLLVNEYDLDGNHIREVIGPNTLPAQNSPAKAAPEYPADWTNHVAEANTAYVVNLPTEPNHMILIRAKSLNDGIHSTETSTIFTDAGIETGISSISTDTDNTSIYYNMQGIRVDHPAAPGLYLRIQNGKTTKINIR